MIMIKTSLFWINPVKLNASVLCVLRLQKPEWPEPTILLLEIDLIILPEDSMTLKDPESIQKFSS